MHSLDTNQSRPACLLRLRMVALVHDCNDSPPVLGFSLRRLCLGRFVLQFQNLCPKIHLCVGQGVRGGRCTFAHIFLCAHVRVSSRGVKARAGSSDSGHDGSSPHAHAACPTFMATPSFTPRTPQAQASCYHSRCRLRLVPHLFLLENSCHDPVVPCPAAAALSAAAVAAAAQTHGVAPRVPAPPYAQQMLLRPQCA
eukprot:1157448-Pelagomonas_calceolata.AAC.4